MANICAAITVEGIMQQKVGGGPIQAGINLYRALSSTFTVALLTDQPADKLDHWLKVEDLRSHSLVLPSAHTYPAETRRTAQALELRKRGFSISMVFDPDPSVCAELLKYGFNACCFVHVAYADPAWRPDFEGPIRSWDDLSEAAVLQRIARNEDARLKEKDKEVGDD